MAWIKLHGELWESYKLPQLCEKLGICEPQAVGHLVSLWSFTERNAWRDGDLTKWGPVGVARAARWAGDSKKFVTAMEEAGFLDDGFVVHEWTIHQAGMIHDRQTRRQCGITAQIPRKSRALTAQIPDNPGEIPDQIRVDKRREDKRREEKKKREEQEAAGAAVGGDRPANWDNCKTDLQRFVVHYVRSEMPDLYRNGTQKQALGVFKRYCRPAKEILEVAGDLQTACLAFDIGKQSFNKQDLSWNLSSVARNIAEFVNIAMQQKAKETAHVH